ncbi:alpha/beta-hydrolase [Rhizoclosmatium globosum]|uniref:Alpha/beta-hydrolase n=1 Tax=Rhizoclosmatium globosum TaxID=329046 RepID=A0A1Y2C573_9FUNG|nr:alpha/beta-hydrolase [Rhizoclosmatium globosum]|eukprot:ORY42183.1 alpha/beta-hydrolase [Rhizoclosmatium globosum]
MHVFRRLFSSTPNQRSIAESLSPSSLPMPTRVVFPHSSALERHVLRGSEAANTLRPAVIVLQEWWGINDTILGHAQRIANNTGAIAVVPDLYNGTITADKEEAAHLMGNLDWNKALTDLELLVARLQRPVDADPALFKDRKVASLGFCMGGALSLAITARMAQINKPLHACVSFYGTPSPKLIDISQIPATTPVQAHFGEHDDHKGFADIATANKLADTWNLTVQKLGGAHAHGFHSLESNVYVHQGVGHAFMNEDGSVRHEVGGEVDKTWEKVFKFLIGHLKTV